MVVANATGQLSTQAISDLSGFVTLATTQTISAPSKTFTNPVTVGSTASVIYSTIGQNYIDIRNGNETTVGWSRYLSNGFTRTKNGFSTNLFVTDPVANTTLNLPAKTVGTYTIATVEDLAGFVTLGTTQTITGLKTFTDSVKIASTTIPPIINFEANGVATANVLSTSGVFQFTASNTSGYLFKNTSLTNTLTLDQTGNAEFLGNISHRPLVSPALWVSQLGSDVSVALRRGALRLRELSNGTGFVANVIPSDLSSDRTYSLPDATGTIALTSDLTGFVTLATTQTISAPSKTFTNAINVGNTGTVLYTTIGQNYVDIHDGNDVTNGWIRHASGGFSRFKNNFSTNLLFANPIANTSLNLPAKTIGTYTIATIEDIAVTVSGTTNQVAKFIGTNTIGNSQIFDNGSGVAIGATSLSGYKLFVQGTGFFNDTVFVANGGSLRFSLNTIFIRPEFVSGAYRDLAFYTNNLERMRIAESGSTTFLGSVTATGFFNSSDARLKDVIGRDGDTVKFTWKDKRDDKTHIGYIAQEVQEKYPDQVNKNEDGMLTVNYIEVLVAKIQELENRIKQLEK